MSKIIVASQNRRIVGNFVLLSEGKVKAEAQNPRIFQFSKPEKSDGSGILSELFKNSGTVSFSGNILIRKVTTYIPNKVVSESFKGAFNNYVDQI